MDFASMSPEQQVELLNLQRRQKVADRMSANGQNQPQGRMVGNIYVPPSITQNLSSLTDQLGGAYLGKQAADGIADLGTQSQEATAQAISDYKRTREGVNPGVDGSPLMMEPVEANPRQAAIDAVTSRDPRLQAIGKFDMQQTQVDAAAALRKDERAESSQAKIDAAELVAAAKVEAADEKSTDKLEQLKLVASLKTPPNNASEQKFQTFASAYKTANPEATEQETAKSFLVAENKTGLPKPPKDMQYNDDGELIVVKGSKTDIKNQESLNKASSSVKTTDEFVNALIRDIDDLIGNETGKTQDPNLESATGNFQGREMFPTFLQGQGVVDTDSNIDSLKKKLSIKGLTEIRAAGTSPGSITEREWPIFEAALGNLDQVQGTPAFIDQLTVVREAAERMKLGARTNFDALTNKINPKEAEGEWEDL